MQVHGLLVCTLRIVSGAQLSARNAYGKQQVADLANNGRCPTSQTFASGDQIAGFQATEVKWKPTIIAFSAAAMS
jgi:hypothetical protein